jgi:myo-inositol-1(or 4)-monophosphatase
MVSHSGLITVMERAARKAAPRIRRDFGEVEQLRSVARARPTSSPWRIGAPSRTLVEELRHARPDWGFC